jgi:CheY-like chemotaxis protein
MLPQPGPRLADTACARRLLIADDQRDWTDLLAAVLRDDGYDVRVAYDGDEAVEQVLEFRPTWRCSTCACRS